MHDYKLYYEISFTLFYRCICYIVIEQLTESESDVMKQKYLQLRRDVARLSNECMRLHTEALECIDKHDAEYLSHMSELADSLLYHAYEMSYEDIDTYCELMRDKENSDVSCQEKLNTIHNLAEHIIDDYEHVHDYNYELTYDDAKKQSRLYRLYT